MGASSNASGYGVCSLSPWKRCFLAHAWSALVIYFDMTNLMEIITAKEVYERLHHTWADLHCVHYGWDKKKPNEIIFDNDSKGNADNTSPWVKLKFYKEFARVTQGYKLLAEDKVIFYYSDFDNANDFVEAVINFTKYYFNDFVFERK